MNYKKGKVENEEPGELPRKYCGVKTLLPSMLHDKVLHMIKFCRCVFNNITIAIGKEIVLENDQTLLKENGGSLNLDFSWCQSISWEIGFTKRQATIAMQLMSLGFLKEMGFSFHWAIKVVETCTWHTWWSSDKHWPNNSAIYFLEWIYDG